MSVAELGELADALAAAKDDSGAASQAEGGDARGAVDATTQDVAKRLRYLQTLLKMLNSSSKIENSVLTPKLCRQLKSEGEALLETARLGNDGTVRLA